VDAVKVLAEGCEHCEPRVALSERRCGDNHYSVNLNDWQVLVYIDGNDDPVEGVAECWVGRPGRVLQYPMPPRLCPCGTPYEHDYRDGLVLTGHGGIFRQLVEYDVVTSFLTVSDSPKES